ncbi:MAG: toll/interleukin-1 receptor domain-containing protein [Agriterribacter sp.]
MPLQKIFFSYSRQDGAEFALKLALDLKKKGFNVWIDQQDIRAGTEWDLEVEKALETCDCLLFIETPRSVVSNNVLDEVYYALGQNKKVIPVILVDSKTPFRIQRIQHVDFTQDYNKGLKRLIQELQNAETNTFVETPQASITEKTFLQQNKGWLLMAAVLVVIITSALWYNNVNRTTLTRNVQDTADEKPIVEENKSISDSAVVNPNIEQTRSAKKQVVAVENKKKIAVDDKSNSPSIKSSTIDLMALKGQWGLKKWI